LSYTLRTEKRLPRICPNDRRDNIIAVATEIFSREGYGSTSMSTIAVALGGSKATLYKYFLSKEKLFEAAIEQCCLRVLAPLRDLRSSEEDDLEALLADFGERFLAKIYEAGALDVYRLIHSESVRFPDLATTFFHSGPDAVLEELRATLEHFAASGKISCEDLTLAAEQFLGMLRGDRHLRFATGTTPAPDATEIAHHAKHAARIFTRGLRPC